MTSYPVSALKVSHDIVEVLLDRSGAGVTEVATALDAPKSTVHDHLKTLDELDYVVNEGGRYRPSTKFLHVGKTARDEHELFVNGRTPALRLSESVDEQHVQLVTEENDRCAVLLATRWQHAARTPRAAGAYPTYVHLHANAPGKAILARWDVERVRTLLDEQGLPEYTPETITDVEVLLEELARVREAGYAVDDGELISGMRGVAAPIVAGDRVRGAIAIYGETGTFPDEPGDSELLERIRESVDAIAANFIFGED